MTGEKTTTATTKKPKNHTCIISLQKVVGDSHTIAENSLCHQWHKPRGGEQCHLPGGLILSSEEGEEWEGHPVLRWEETEIAFCQLINN